MRKLFTLAFVLFVSIIAYAQPGGGHGGQRQRMTTEERVKLEIKDLTEALSLTSKQVDKITPILTENTEKTSALREKGLSREDARAEMQKLRAELTEDISTELTEVQQVKYKEHLEKQKVQWGQRGGEPRR